MMECENSIAPNDEELLSYALDDEPLSREAIEHLNTCPLCQERLSRYKQLNAYLLEKLYRKQCPDATKINYYCAQLLPLDEVFSIESHLRICPLCASEVATIRQTLADFEPFPASELFIPLMPLYAPTRSVVASFVPVQQLAATRTAQVSMEWPRQYRAEMFAISLHLSRSSYDHAMLLGLFTSIDPKAHIDAFEGVLAKLYQSPAVSPDATSSSLLDLLRETPLMTAHIDDLGNIIFNAVPPGEYVMIVNLPEIEVVIENLVIS